MRPVRSSARPRACATVAAAAAVLVAGLFAGSVARAESLKYTFTGSVVYSFDANDDADAGTDPNGLMGKVATGFVTVNTAAPVISEGAYSKSYDNIGDYQIDLDGTTFVSGNQLQLSVSAGNALDFTTGTFWLHVDTNNALNFALPTGAVDAPSGFGRLQVEKGAYVFDVFKFELVAPASTAVPLPGAAAGGLALLGGLAALRRRRDAIA